MIIYKPGMPVFDGYHIEEKRPLWPVLVGLPLFGVAYGLSMVIGARAGAISGDQGAWDPMYIPVVGPFMALDSAADRFESDGERAFVASAGVFQIVSLALPALRWFLPAKKLLVLGGNGGQPGATGSKVPPPDWLLMEPYAYKAGAGVQGYMAVERRKTWLIVLGGSALVTGYLTAAVVGLTGVMLSQRTLEPEWAPMFVPIAGPFITIATTGATGIENADVAGALSVPGLMQALGLGAMIGGLFLAPEKVLVPVTPYGEVRTGARRGPTLELHMPRLDFGRVAPAHGDGFQGGIALDGEFDF